MFTINIVQLFGKHNVPQEETQCFRQGRKFNHRRICVNEEIFLSIALPGGAKDDDDHGKPEKVAAATDPQGSHPEQARLRGWRGGNARVEPFRWRSSCMQGVAE